MKPAARDNTVSPPNLSKLSSQSGADKLETPPTTKTVESIQTKETTESINNRMSRNGVNKLCKFNTAGPVMSPNRGLVHLKLPKIAQYSDEVSQESEAEVQMGEVDVSVIVPGSTQEFSESILFPGSTPSFDPADKLGRVAVPKALKRGTKRLSLLDLHMSDPKRYRKVTKAELQSNAYERYRKK